MTAMPKIWWLPFIKGAMSFRHFAADIKLAHSMFALPFAAAVFFISDIQFPEFNQIMLLLLCMVSARSFAMGFNRLLDWQLDLQNPRTAVRAIPSGKLKPFEGLIWCLVSAAIFIGTAFSFNVSTGVLAIPLLFVLAFYSQQKKLWYLTHWYLGMCLGLAPIAVVVALSETIPMPIYLLGAAVMFWTAGFDILYALQDRAFDLGNHLKSVPAQFGTKKALIISRISFAVMFILLLLLGYLAQLGFIYYLGVMVIGLFLVYEHYLVRDSGDQNISRYLNKAFFNSNAYVSVIYFCFSLMDFLWR